MHIAQKIIQILCKISVEKVFILWYCKGVFVGGAPAKTLVHSAHYRTSVRLASSFKRRKQPPSVFGASFTRRIIDCKTVLCTKCILTIYISYFSHFKSKYDAWFVRAYSTQTATCNDLIARVKNR